VRRRRALGKVRGKQVRRLPRDIREFRGLLPVSCFRIRFHSPTHRATANLSTIEFQPVLQVSVWRGWYLKSVDAAWNIGWRRHSPTMVPLSLGVGRVMVRPGLPPLNFYVSGQWMAYRQFAPIAPQTSVNFGMTVAFPELRR